jgi:hypothetical protein
MIAKLKRDLSTKRLSAQSHQKPQCAKAVKSCLKSSGDIDGEDDKLSGLKVASRRVIFNEVQVREYDRCLGDNPSCSAGPPIRYGYAMLRFSCTKKRFNFSHAILCLLLSIGWRYAAVYAVPLDVFEYARGRPRTARQLVLSRQDREYLLLEWGATFNEIIESVRANIKIKNQRRRTVRNSQTYDLIGEAISNVKRKIKPKAKAPLLGTKKKKASVKQTETTVDMSDEEQSTRVDTTSTPETDSLNGSDDSSVLLSASNDDDGYVSNDDDSTVSYESVEERKMPISEVRVQLPKSFWGTERCDDKRKPMSPKRSTHVTNEECRESVELTPGPHNPMGNESPRSFSRHDTIPNLPHRGSITLRRAERNDKSPAAPTRSRSPTPKPSSNESPVPAASTRRLTRNSSFEPVSASEVPNRRGRRKCSSWDAASPVMSPSRKRFLGLPVLDSLTDMSSAELIDGDGSKLISSRAA